MLIGLFLYPQLTALDAVGPYEVLTRVPDVQVLFVGAAAGPVVAQNGLQLVVDTPYSACPQLDALLVPGGPGMSQQLEDPALLQFLRTQAEGAQWITSVCTGSLILGAAGLLRGYRATTHWRYVDALRDLGAVPVRKRIVADRNRVTAAGVSAGIDMGLFFAARLAGEQTAQAIQLQLEYDPQPPFRSGSPDVADPEIVERVMEATEALYQERREQIRRLGAQG